MSADDVAPAAPSGRLAFAWALGSVVVAVFLAVGVGLVVGLVMRALVTDAETDGWAGLAAVVVGVVVGVGAGVLAWVVGLVVAARRLFPRGRRLAVVLLTMAVTLVGSVVAVALLGMVGAGGAVTGGENQVGAIVVVAALAAGVYPWWARRVGRSVSHALDVRPAP
ncbi:MULTISPECIES: hypothetical protein [unclassified Actinotalea]|uniref:hypothetical protein n=1 Tax=unclassified Actinotalea TaxID=2638618 RepID=UPI0015F405FF|nr:MULTISPECIES: hypothetical protein [unclassified Actinotalea]